MANPHSSVKYVEPNYVFSGLTAAAGDGETYDRAPDLEDYCISLDIIAELSSRHKSITQTTPEENRVIAMSYTDSKGGKSTVRFMSGTKVGGYSKTNSGEFSPNLTGANVLTSYYADMHITDLVDYGTTELLGIKSVDIDYNSTCVPVITIKFTDVRGMSIFQPSELNDDVSYNGIRGFSKDNIAQSFFHAFFTLPLPKFTIILKGFYGEPVSYQVMCDKFDTAFDSANGYFDVTARFIGYAYSFMADVSFNALLAAPYSDYLGESYWESQTTGDKPRFVIPDKNGIPMPMPKLYDIRKNIETLIVDSDSEGHDSSDEAEDRTHETEIQELTRLRGAYRAWYDSLYTMCCNKYGTDYCYRLGGTTEDDDYRRIIIFTNGKNISGADLSSEYLQFDESFRKQTGDLKNAIDDFNSSSNAHRKLSNIMEGFKYPRVKVFRDIWINDRTRLLMFDGFTSENTLPKKETIDVVFGNTTESQQSALKKLYNDGKYQYIDAFVIDLDYTGLKTRINSLIYDANKQSNEKVKERKALNRRMYDKMGWYPTIENITKIVMAHLETLMFMMYDIIDKTVSRTVASLGVGRGDDGVVDVNQYDDNVAPFPRLTTLITDADGYTKSEDAWAGDFTQGEGFKEVDIVNGLFNGAAKISQLEESIQKAVDELNSENVEIQAEEARGVMPMPITTYDFFTTTNPYGSDGDVVDDVNSFAGKVCMRMFGILALSYFRKQFEGNWVSLADKLGVIEAKNFMALNKITNPNILSALGENGALSNADDILKIVTGKGDSSAKLPWSNGNDGDNVLFRSGDGFWLTRYRNKQRGVYPVNDISFSKMNEVFNAVNAGKTPLENNDVTIFDSYSKSQENFLKILNMTGDTSVMNTIKFTENFKTIWEIFSGAESCGVEEYKGVMTAVGNNIIPDEKDLASKYMFINDIGKSFNNRVDDNILLNAKEGKDIPIRDDRSTMYASGGPTRADYEFDSSTYVTEMFDRNIQSYTLTECFGYKIENKSFIPDRKKSLFTMKEFYKIDKAIVNNNTHEIIFTSNVRKVAFFVMGIDSMDYSKVRDCLLNDSFSYIPNLAALQIGAVIGTYYGGYNIASKINLDIVRRFMPVWDEFKELTNVINSMSPYTKIAYAKYFRDWAVRNYWRIDYLTLIEKDGKWSCKGDMKNDRDHYEKVYDDGKSPRACFKQSSNLIKHLTNDLMSAICVVRLTVSALDITGDEHDQDAVKFSTFKFDESQAKVFLTSFLKTIREDKGIVNSEDGGPTTIANSPSQTSDDMKIELYRYLKQLYDKWVSCTDFETWKFDKFFGDEQSNNPLGNNFFFIDSFYNKIGDKLLINPRKLSELLGLSVKSVDTNEMMYNFLAQIYAHHRCMMKCVQNFKNLANGIGNIFVPVPYNLSRKPKIMPDFVVVYAYEASRNLDIANTEFKNDGFMLNDELETPLPIKSRGDESKFYRIPAFGVSYGRQYQHYFKNVNVNMAHPVMTEQAIIAKYNILSASRSKVFKNTTAQDLYDIYSNQSYTCTVEMMGCAYVQPLMYFVLLNIPFFKGSYLISEVRHRMIPGDMTTEITGVRMSKYCNKMVTDIFTDEEDDTLMGGGTYGESPANKYADTSNDCPYRVFPIVEDVSELTGTDKQKSKELMDMVASTVFGGSCSTPSIKIASAGIVGNMKQETGDFDHTHVVIDSDKFPAGGLCGWNDRYYNLTNLVNNTPGQYGSKDRKKTGEKANSLDWYKKKLVEKGVSYQVTFLANTIGSGLKSRLLAASTPESAAKIFRDEYEKGTETAKRQSYARSFYNAYDSTDTSSSKKSEDKVNNDYPKLFFNAVQKSLNTTNKYAGELEATYNGSAVKITCKGDDKAKLAVVFDIILNSDEYYNSMNNLNWVYVNSPTELPSFIEVNVVANTPQNQRVISIYDGKQATATNKLTGDDCNEKLMQSLRKKYGSNKALFEKECPQFSNAKDSIDKFKLTDCSTLFTTSGGGRYGIGKGVRAATIKALGFSDHPTKEECGSKMVTVKVKYGNGSKQDLTVHKDLANDVVKIFDEIYAAGFNVKYSCAYGYRPIRNPRVKNPTTLSMHSFGCAIDINPSDNPFIGGAHEEPTGDTNVRIRTLNSVVVRIFKKYGWGWGGTYGDYMHFSTADGH